MKKTLRDLAIGILAGVLGTLVVQWLTEPRRTGAFLISSAHAAESNVASKHEGRACYYEAHEEFETTIPSNWKELDVNSSGGTVTATSLKSGGSFHMTLSSGLLTVDTTRSQRAGASFMGIIYLVCDVYVPETPDEITFTFDDVAFLGTGGNTILAHVYMSNRKSPVHLNQDYASVYPILISTAHEKDGTSYKPGHRKITLPFPRRYYDAQSRTFRFVIEFRDAWGDASGTDVRMAEPILDLCYDAVLKSC